MTKIVLLLMMVAIVASSCATVPPIHDWCYRFTFADSNYGAAVYAGNWLPGTGMTTNESGDLSFSFANPNELPVRFTSLFFYANPDPAATTPIDVSVNAIVFGYAFSGAFSVDPFPQLLPIVPADAWEINSTANISIHASQFVSIRTIEVRGDEANPFGENSCAGELTPTPSWTPTNVTPTTTYSATETPTPTTTNTPITNTPTASSTPTTWCQHFDFTASTAGWSSYPYNDGATYFATAGWGRSAHPSYTGRGHFVTTFGMSTYVTTVAVTRGSPMTGDRREIQIAAWDGASVTNSAMLSEGVPTTTRTMNATASGIFIGQYQSVVSTVQLNSSVLNVTLRGTGANPYAASNCDLPPTETPTQTQTSAATATQTPTITRTPTKTRTPTRTPVIVNIPGTLTATASPTPNTPTITPIPPTVTASRTMLPSPTLFMTGTPSGTPTGTVTPGVPGGTDDEDAGEIAILDAIGAFFNWIQNAIIGLFDLIVSIVNWIGGAISNILSAIGNVFQIVGDILGAIWRLIVEIFDILRLLLEIIVGFIRIIFAWLGQMISRVSALLYSFFTAPLTPIPGLPQCVSDPTANDFCALWYILDYTLFADNTPGSIIVPILILDMDIWILIFFARFVMKLLKRGESVTDVG